MESIVVMFDNKDKILNMSLYEFMDIEVESDIPFVVCNVNKEDYKEIEKQVNLGHLQERLPRLDLTRKTYNSNRYVAGYNRELKEILLSNPDGIMNGKYSIKDGILKYNADEIALSTDEMASVFGKHVKIYTTETYEDIINHYMLNKVNEIDLNEMNKSEVEMRLKAINKELYRLAVIKTRLTHRMDEIKSKEETPGEYFIKYSK